jgi:hypothetical protein
MNKSSFATTPTSVKVIQDWLPKGPGSDLGFLLFLAHVGSSKEMKEYRIKVRTKLIISRLHALTIFFYKKTPTSTPNVSFGENDQSLYIRVPIKNRALYAIQIAYWIWQLFRSSFISASSRYFQPLYSCNKLHLQAINTTSVARQVTKYGPSLRLNMAVKYVVLAVVATPSS